MQQGSVDVFGNSQNGSCGIELYVFRGNGNNLSGVNTIEQAVVIDMEYGFVKRQLSVQLSGIRTNG